MIREVKRGPVTLRIDSGPQVLALDCPAHAEDQPLAKTALGHRPGGVPVRAAQALGRGERPDGPVGAVLEAFLQDQRASKPLGFYSWLPELGRVFQQDRFLQRALELPEAESIASALREGPCREAYDAWMRLAEGLSGPLVSPDLRSAVIGAGPAFAPASESVEGALVNRLFASRPIPESFNLADRLIDELRAGRVDLTPRRDAGWYELIAWSLESLASPDRCPEAARLRYSPAYRKTLADLFKGILALTRETQVKQLESPEGSAVPAGPLEVRPELTVEPLPTHYWRRALGYRRVRTVLERAFGPGALAKLRRLLMTGPSARPLDDFSAL